MPPPTATTSVENGTPDIAMTVTTNLKKIQKFLSKMVIPTTRRRLYDREIEGLLNLRRPDTMVAICGGTGAGKSSLLNALLDAEIVPTSSVRACTAVVTQLSWNHDSDQMIAADVEFLTKAEWIEELAILLSDLADQGNERVKHPNQLNGVGATAWAKIHAVYPSISFQSLATMTTDVFLQRFPPISQLLGTEARVEAPDAEQFRRALEPYLDARESPESQALWPLIRRVKIFCRSAALSTGLTLVDLPGSADTNAARDKIASNFLKDCDFCWIVSPVTRVVSDKVASDLLGHTFRLQLQLDGKLSTSNSITFIATKNENIKTAEVVSNLNLEDDIDFQGLSEDLAICRQELDRWNEGMRGVNADVASTRKRIADGKNRLNRYKHDLAGLLGGNGMSQSNGNSLPDGALKRKYISLLSPQEQEGGSKRKRRCRASDPPQVHDGAAPALGPGQVNAGERPSHTSDDMSVEELNSAICSEEENLQSLNEELSGVTEFQHNIALGRESAFKDVQDIEREICAFCAIQRAEYSRRRLRDDFRKNLEEYAVDRLGQDDLPVFVVSSWDYMKLQAGLKSECFSSINQTEIPALREWCHGITRPARNETARTLATQFRAFAIVLKTFLEDADSVTEEDRRNIRRQWGSSSRQFSLCESDPAGEMRRASALTGDSLQGIVAHLLKSFHEVIEDTVQGLQSQFAKYLGDDCDEGAVLAAAAAVKTSKNFADRKEMIWQRYRALLRRNGRFGDHDLNAELIMPFVSHIAQNWTKLFRSNLFRVFETATVQVVEKLAEEVVQSVPEYLISHAKKQVGVSLERTRVFVGESANVMQRTLDAQQRVISRRLVPRVEEQLKDGYKAALLITGRGSTPLQKAAVHQYIDEKKDDVFRGAADALMGGLDEAAKVIGTALEEDLAQLSLTVETTIAVLWEGPAQDEKGDEARLELLELLDEAIAQTGVWLKEDSQQRRPRAVSESAS